MNGLFDFQVNGFGGVDFQQADLNRKQFDQAISALRRHGVAGFFPTLITDDIDQLCRRLERFQSLCSESPLMGTAICGYHLEGPWLSPKPGYCGAHNPEAMHAPSEKEFDRLQTAADGRIRLVTLAPEWPGSAAFITTLTARGVNVSIGYSDASEKEIDLAIQAGARFCTHLGNTTPLQLHRHDNIVQRLLARDELTACFIPDGVHLPRNVLKNFVRAKPADRILFTTDAMAAAGAGPGEFTLGHLNVEVASDGVARQPSGNGLAGSTLTPDRGVMRTAQHLGIDLEKVRSLWSTSPSRAFWNFTTRLSDRNRSYR